MASINWTSSSKLPLKNAAGEIVGLVGITREINELKQKEMDLQHIATHDRLTSLPNRYLFFDRLEQTINRAKRNQTLCAILFLDLDHFKIINDQQGHDAGDEFLKLVAIQLQNAVRISDTVARLGGDEFAILLETIRDETEACGVAERIIAGIHALDSGRGHRFDWYQHFSAPRRRSVHYCSNAPIMPCTKPRNRPIPTAYSNISSRQ